MNIWVHFISLPARLFVIFVTFVVIFGTSLLGAHFFTAHAFIQNGCKMVWKLIQQQLIRLVFLWSNRPYSEVNKSTRAKVAIIFAYSKKCVFFFEYKLTRFDCCNNIKSNYAKPEVSKITITFALFNLLTF
jgi:hypothetical protein